MEPTNEPDPERRRRSHSSNAHPSRPEGLSDDADGPEPAGLYSQCLTPEDRAMYEAASADPDLADEIRLMRAALARLSGDLSGNHLAMTRVLTALIRTIVAQARQLGVSTALERILLHQGDEQRQKGERS